VSTVLTVNIQAQLVQLDDGSIRVFYEGMQYTKGQQVPFHIFGMDSNPARHSTAESFVVQYMLAKYGADRRAWPALAVEFVAAKDSS